MTIFKESDFLEQNDVAWLTMLQSWAQLETGKLHEKGCSIAADN